LQEPGKIDWWVIKHPDDDGWDRFMLPEDDLSPITK